MARHVFRLRKTLGLFKPLICNAAESKPLCRLYLCEAFRKPPFFKWMIHAPTNAPIWCILQVQLCTILAAIVRCSKMVCIMDMTKYPENNIKSLRKAKGLTVDQIAEAVGTSREQIRRLEKCERELTHSWMIKLAPVFKFNHGISSVRTQR